MIKYMKDNGKKIKSMDNIKLENLIGSLKLKEYCNLNVVNGLINK